MNYSIIKDEKSLKDFIDWLPDLEDGETYYVCLFARSKYTKDIEGKNGIPHIKSDKAQLKRFTAKKKDLLSKIRQLECPIGAYMQKDIIVPQEALALYITPNPRSMTRATLTSITALVKCIQNQNKLSNPHQEVMSEIQRCKSRTVWVDFDFDHKEDTGLLPGDKPIPYITSLKPYIYDRVGESATVKFLETRGGYHVLIKPDTIEYPFKTTWHQQISMNVYLDQSGDQMIPVPGCTQGNFIPKFI